MEKKDVEDALKHIKHELVENGYKGAQKAIDYEWRRLITKELE